MVSGTEPGVLKSTTRFSVWFFFLSVCLSINLSLSLSLSLCISYDRILLLKQESDAADGGRMASFALGAFSQQQRVDSVGCVL